MQPEQEVIARWVVSIKSRSGLSYQRWADRAGLGAATTLTRAIKPDYTSVTAVPTLHALARAADVPSILDFLEQQTQVAETGRLPSAVNEEAIATLLGAILPTWSKERQSARSLRVLAATLLHGLELLQGQSASDPSKDALGVAARAAVARLRDLQQQ